MDNMKSSQGILFVLCYCTWYRRTWRKVIREVLMNRKSTWAGITQSTKTDVTEQDLFLKCIGIVKLPVIW